MFDLPMLLAAALDSALQYVLCVCRLVPDSGFKFTDYHLLLCNPGSSVQVPCGPASR